MAAGEACRAGCTVECSLDDKLCADGGRVALVLITSANEEREYDLKEPQISPPAGQSQIVRRRGDG